jgi:formamidopyrimidine-DNA glycosylase
MPEIAEVECARRLVADNLLGKKIVKVTVHDDSKMLGAEGMHLPLERMLLNNKIKAAKR